MSDPGSPTCDLVLRAATLRGRAAPVDIAVRDGKFAGISESLAERGLEEFLCDGKLLLPPLVDPHFHLDSVNSVHETGPNHSGTLLEGITIWQNYKRRLTPENIHARAHAYCEGALRMGLLHIRSHVDVSYESLAGVEALVSLRQEWHGKIDIQLVAFPQDGALRNNHGLDLLQKGLDLGLDVVGGIPHHERTTADGTASTHSLCKIAADRGLPVDFHCDETDDPQSRHVETLAACAMELGLAGRVAASHTTSLGSADNAFFQKLAALLHEADVSIIANPLINIILQGRSDTYPKRRGITRVPELLAAGVNVAAGMDCVADPWYPLGTGDPLDVSHMSFHVCHMTAQEDIPSLVDLVTTNAAKALGLADYGISVGKPADFILLDCRSELDAIRYRPPRLLVARGGQLLFRHSSTAPTESDAATGK